MARSRLSTLLAYYLITRLVPVTVEVLNAPPRDYEPLTAGTRVVHPSSLDETSESDRTGRSTILQDFKLGETKSAWGLSHEAAFNVPVATYEHGFHENPGAHDRQCKKRPRIGNQAGGSDDFPSDLWSWINAELSPEAPIQKVRQAEHVQRQSDQAFPGHLLQHSGHSMTESMWRSRLDSHQACLQPSSATPTRVLVSFGPYVTAYDRNLQRYESPTGRLQSMVQPPGYTDEANQGCGPLLKGTVLYDHSGISPLDQHILNQCMASSLESEPLVSEEDLIGNINYKWSGDGFSPLLNFGFDEQGRSATEQPPSQLDHHRQRVKSSHSSPSPAHRNVIQSVQADSLAQNKQTTELLTKACIDYSGDPNPALISHKLGSRKNRPRLNKAMLDYYLERVQDEMDAFAAQCYMSKSAVEVRKFEGLPASLYRIPPVGDQEEVYFIRMTTTLSSIRGRFEFPHRIKGFLGTLFKYVVLDQSAFLHKLKTSNASVQDAQDEILNWLVKELFQPASSLPVMATIKKSDVEKILKSRDSSSFGEVQELIMESIASDEKKTLYLIADQLILIWYKRFHNSSFKRNFQIDWNFWGFLRAATKCFRRRPYHKLQTQQT